MVFHSGAQLMQSLLKQRVLGLECPQFLNQRLDGVMVLETLLDQVVPFSVGFLCEGRVEDVLFDLGVEFELDTDLIAIASWRWASSLLCFAMVYAPLQVCSVIGSPVPHWTGDVPWICM